MSATRRALFTSAVQPIAGASPNVYAWNKRTVRARIVETFINHPGLSFLRANVPDLEVLEYPDWPAFQEAMRDPPAVLGISSHVNEVELAVRMAQYARRCGVREIWAGNYAAYCPEIAQHVDRLITGWGEKSVAALLGSEAADPLVHPPIYGSMGVSGLPLVGLHGFLYSSRGCPFDCHFCQTPDFYGRSSAVPLESIERVLATYAEDRVASVHVLDENFGIFPRHAREVIRLLHRYGLRWMPLCRVDLLVKHFDEWREHGLYGAHIGLESLNTRSLAGANKRSDEAVGTRALRLLSEHNMVVQAFYIIGFEEDTVASIREDITKLAALDVDLPQIQILTPYPRTELARRVSQTYGLTTDNLSKFNSRNLVWSHPSISAEEMVELQVWANELLFTPARALRTLSKMALYDCRRSMSLRGLGRVWDGTRPTVRRQALRKGLQATAAWGVLGWDAYEEQPDDTVLCPAQRDYAPPAAPGLLQVGGAGLPRVHPAASGGDRPRPSEPWKRAAPAGPIRGA